MYLYVGDTDNEQNSKKIQIATEEPYNVQDIPFCHPVPFGFHREKKKDRRKTTYNSMLTLLDEYFIQKNVMLGPFILLSQKEESFLFF